MRLLAHAVGLVTLTCVLGCPEYSLRPNTHTDVFVQETRNTVDILLVVDNSCSMIDEQAKLADNFQSFIDAFIEADVDYQIGVVTTDQEQEHHKGRLRCSAEARGTVPGPFTITEGVNDALELSFYDGTATSTFDFDKYDDYCTPVGGDVSCSAAVVADWINGDFADYVFAAVTESEQVWITTELPCVQASIEVGNGSMNDVIGLEADFSMTGVQLITPDTPNAAEHFAANVHVGNRGSGWEQGLAGAYLALSEPLITEENAPFLRPDAALSIVFVSDEEDKSPDPVDYYLDYYYSVKSGEDGWDAYRDDTILDISAVVGDVPDGCEQDLGGDIYPAEPGYRYIDLAMRTGGVYDSICNVDFSPMVQVLGLNISGLRSEFFLSRYPDEVTLEVFVDDELVNEGWIYNCANNSIAFADGHAPPGDSTVSVAYTVVPRPSDGACSGTEDAR